MSFIYVILSLISFFYDRLTSNCRTPGVMNMLNSLFHHFLSMYLWFGPLLFGRPLVHLLLTLGVLFGWRLFGWKCVVTIQYNRLCGLPDDENHKDLIYLFVKHTGISYMNLILSVILYDFFRTAYKYS